MRNLGVYKKFRRKVRYLGDNNIVSINNGNVLPLPPDLAPRVVYEKNIKRKGGFDKDYVLQRLLENSDILVATSIIDRGFVARTYSITSVPQQVILSQKLSGYIIINPTPTAGLTTTGTVLSSALHALSSSGNTEADSIGVAAFRNAAFFLNISASGGGVVTVNTESLDPVSQNWATIQSDIFTSPSAIGTYYANIGSLGLDTDFAVSWAVSAAGSSTFSIGYVLKDGLQGSASGTDNTVFIGGPGVTVQSGYPLLEGKELKAFLRENTELWAVSNSNVTLKVFELQ